MCSCPQKWHIASTLADERTSASIGCVEAMVAAQCVLTLGADCVGMAPNECSVEAMVAAQCVLTLGADCVGMAPNECDA